MKKLLASVAAIFLASCGGGGGVGGGSSTPPTSISLSTHSVSFSQHDENVVSGTGEVVVTFVGDGVVAGYPPGVEVPGWLGVSAEGNTASSATFTLSVIANYPAGTYHATVRFVTGRVSGEQVSDLKYSDVDVTLVVDDYLKLGSSREELVAYHGGAHSQDAGIDVRGDIPGWVASSTTPWLHFARDSGSAADDVAFYADTAGMAEGTYFGSLSVRRSDNAGTARTANVVLTVQRNTLVPELRAVAFSQHTGQAAPPPVQVKITDAAGAGIAWTAVNNYSDSWVSFSSSGAAGTPLTISVDPAARTFADDITYTTVITLKTDPDNGAPSYIYVSYTHWSTTDPGAHTIDITPAVSGSPLKEEVAIDPLRQLAFVTNGTDTVRIFSVPNGVEKSSTTRSGQQISRPVTSDDGYKIYVLGSDAPDSYDPAYRTRPVYAIDTYYQAFDPYFYTRFRWKGDAQLDYAEARIGGSEVLVSNRGEVVGNSSQYYRDATESNPDGSPAFARVTSGEAGGALYFFDPPQPSADSCNSILRQTVTTTVGTYSNDYRSGLHFGLPHAVSPREGAGNCVLAKWLTTDVAHTALQLADATANTLRLATPEWQASSLATTEAATLGAIRFLKAVPGSRTLLIEELSGASPAVSRAVLLRDPSGAVVTDFGRFGPGAESAVLSSDGRRVVVVDRDETAGKLRLHVIPVP